MLCKIWGFHGSNYEECRLMGYKNPVRTSQETHYVSTTELSQLMPCKIWGFHDSDYKECRLLGDVTPCGSCKRFGEFRSPVNLARTELISYFWPKEGISRPHWNKDEHGSSQVDSSADKWKSWEGITARRVSEFAAATAVARDERRHKAPDTFVTRDGSIGKSARGRYRLLILPSIWRVIYRRRKNQWNNEQREERVVMNQNWNIEHDCTTISVVSELTRVEKWDVSTVSTKYAVSIFRTDPGGGVFGTSYTYTAHVLCIMFN
jgi:hypothetical protein